MKKTRLIIIMFAMIVGFTLVACSNHVTALAENPEESMLSSTQDYAANVFSENDIVVPVEITVDRDEIYTINLGGYIQKCQFSDNRSKLDSRKFITSEISDKKILKIVHSAQEHVVNYISTSSILEDTEELIEKVKTIPIYHLDNPSDFMLEDSAALYYDSALYIIQDKGICEWMICHELVHHLRYLTCQNTDSNNFDEGMTDVIVSYMNPDIPKNFISGYVDLYPFIEYYIGIFQEDALYDFFYGYKENFGVLSISTPCEHDAFVHMLDYIDKNNTFPIIISSLLYEWDNRFSA